MAIRLRSLRDDEFPAFFAATKAGYAEDIAEHGGQAADEAQAKAERDMAQTLPDGLATENQFIYVLEDEQTSERVGQLWLAERRLGNRRVAWVYDVAIGEPHRRRGYGREAMLLAEQKARELGLTWIELNVFGGNEPARSLYRSLGYVERAVIMGKRLDERA